jgi:hypothetical protein
MSLGKKIYFNQTTSINKLSELIYPTVKPAYENGQMFYFVNSKFTIIQLVSLGRAFKSKAWNLCPYYHKLTGQDILFACLF